MTDSLQLYQHKLPQVDNESGRKPVIILSKPVYSVAADEVH